MNCPHEIDITTCKICPLAMPAGIDMGADFGHLLMRLARCQHRKARKERSMWCEQCGAVCRRMRSKKRGGTVTSMWEPSRVQGQARDLLDWVFKTVGVIEDKLRQDSLPKNVRLMKPRG